MSVRVRKGVFPAAGLGTRFLPATKAQPKEMLPLVDKPTIQYVVEEAVASGLGEIIIQARKTFVSLIAPRRTFARIQPTTKSRVDLGLRLENQKPGGRLQPSRIHESMPLQVCLHSPDEVDTEVLGWLQRAYTENS